MPIRTVEDQLRETVRRYRHVQGEHARQSEDSSLRRKRETELEELKSQFEGMLDHWVDDDALRAGWQDHLFEGGPEPDLEGEIPPVYKGRSKVGSILVVRPNDSGEWEYVVDGSLAAHHPEGWRYGGPGGMHFAGQAFEEVLDAPAEAVEALRAHFADPSGEPPWQWAPALIREGLIDMHFSLTDRGRRLIEA
ncbi:MAG: hypothetical protein PVI24_08985 [Myxococcales bacterium]